MSTLETDLLVTWLFIVSEINFIQVTDNLSWLVACMGKSKQHRQDKTFTLFFQMYLISTNQMKVSVYVRKMYEFHMSFESTIANTTYLKLKVLQCAWHDLLN